MTEKELLENVRQMARLFGWLTYHTHNSRRSEPGFPDLVMVRSSRIIFAELKTMRGRLTVDQLVWLGCLSQTNAEYFLWRPEDWDSGQIERTLRG